MIKSVLEEITAKPVSSITVVAILCLGWLAHYVIHDKMDTMHQSIQELHTIAQHVNDNSTEIRLLQKHNELIAAELESIKKTLEERREVHTILLKNRQKP